MATMKAVRIHKYGGVDVLRYEEAPRPEPAADEILIEVRATSVNPVDWKIRQGWLQNFIPHRLPLILGWDVAGVVTQAGSQVTSLQPGDAVYARPDLARDGAYADYIVVKAAEVAHKPTTVDFEQAAAIPLAGITAWEALLMTGKLTAGQRVLIHAAAGGVGSLAVQLAKIQEAYVIATASADNQVFLQALGADECIDYRSTRFETIVKDIDLVFDTMGGEIQARSWQVLKPDGLLVSIVDPPAEREAQRWSVRCAFVFIQPNAGYLKAIADLIDAGRLHPIVSQVLPLSRVQEAHQLSESGHMRGKLLLTP